MRHLVKIGTIVFYVLSDSALEWFLDLGKELVENEIWTKDGPRERTLYFLR